jgi:hypothetical protein
MSRETHGRFRGSYAGPAMYLAFPLANPRRAALAVAAALVGAGCGSTDIRGSYALHERGDFQAAAADIVLRSDEQSRFRQYDTVWLLLERGKMLQDAGRFAESNSAFQQARTILDNLDDAAVVSVNSIGNEIGAMQTDDRQTDYVGTGYDRILLHTAMAINFAMLGDLESAAANVRAQLDRQQQAVALNEKRLASIAARERQDAGRQGAMDGTQWNASFADLQARPEFQDEMKRTMGLSGGRDGYADYHVPYGYVVGALLLSAAGRHGEAEDMAKLAADPSLRVEFDAAGRPLGDEIVVVFENGMAPARVDASFMYVGPNGPTKVPVPRIEIRSQHRAARLEVAAVGVDAESRFVDSVDGIVVTDFRNALPVVWFRAMVQAMIKEMETWVARRAAQNNLDNDPYGHRPANADMAELGILIAGVVARNIVEPDLRSWRSLPGEHHVLRVDRPETDTLFLSLVGPAGMGGASTTVRLPPGPGPHLVYVRSTNLSSLAAYAAPLRGGPRG